ncbi:MAG: ParB N-terminal domain-containing protein [Planctomycetia bacterium]|nr:ParB N-terminal domain-containing protein [Planctomycetia bacterium]
MLPLASIVVDAAIQCRVGLNAEHLKRLADAMERGKDLDPIDVFQDGDAPPIVADGFHRHETHLKAGRASIPCIVHSGGRREAVLFAAGANARHGLPRTNADKRRAVGKLLADSVWGQWSDRAIADKCGVSHTFVAAARATGNRCQSSTRRCADGRTIDTAKIGSKRAARPEWLRPIRKLHALLDSGQPPAKEAIQALRDLLARLEEGFG